MNNRLLFVTNYEYQKNKPLKKPKRKRKNTNECRVSYANVCKRLHTSTKLDVREY